jgi:hypothetical protein
VDDVPLPTVSRFVTLLAELLAAGVAVAPPAAGVGVGVGFELVPVQPATATTAAINKIPAININFVLFSIHNLQV